MKKKYLLLTLTLASLVAAESCNTPQGLLAGCKGDVTVYSDGSASGCITCDSSSKLSKVAPAFGYSYEKKP